MDAALNNILLHFGINAAASRQMFAGQATMGQLQKNASIFVAGKNNSSEYLLISGVAHRYHISENGSQVTTGFYMGPAVITPHFARTRNGKSLYGLQTLTDAVLAQIPVAQLDALRAADKEFREFGQRVVEQELSLSVLQEVAYRSLSARERLLAMREQYPNLENLVPHHVIASYLGITHVSFSRLRKELSGRQDFIK